MDGVLGADIADARLFTHPERTADWAQYNSYLPGPKQRVDIHVEVHQSFSKMAEMTGSLSISQGAGQLRIESGQSAELHIAAKAAADVLAADNSSIAAMLYDRVYGTYVRIEETLYEDTRPAGATNPNWTYSDTRIVWLTPYRYISAVFPDITADFPGIPDDQSRLQFEPTRTYAISDLYSNMKRVEVYAPFGVRAVNPDGRVYDTFFNSVPQSFSIKYWPDSNASSLNDPVTISLTGGPSGLTKVIGSLVVQGTAVPGRTWWIDETALESRLREVFPEWVEIEDFGAMANRIANNINTRYGRGVQLATRVSVETDAQIRVRMFTAAESAIIPTDDGGWTEFPGLYAMQRRLDDILRNFASYNAPQRSYLLGEIVKTAASPDFVISAINVSAFTYNADLEASLIKTISHEIGHAIGFAGHIAPSIPFDANTVPWDVMQQGSPPSPHSSATSFVESSAMLQLLVGIGWNTTKPEESLEILRTAAANGRRHDLELRWGNYSGGPVVQQADYAIWKNTFSMIVEAGSSADGNGDRVVNAADYTVWRDNLGRTVTAVGAAAHKELISPADMPRETTSDAGASHVSEVDRDLFSMRQTNSLSSVEYASDSSRLLPPWVPRFRTNQQASVSASQGRDTAILEITQNNRLGREDTSKNESMQTEFKFYDDCFTTDMLDSIFERIGRVNPSLSALP